MTSTERLLVTHRINAECVQIESASITAYEKRYDIDQNKFYTFVIEVRRASGAVSTIFRRFKCGPKHF